MNTPRNPHKEKVETALSQLGVEREDLSLLPSNQYHQMTHMVAEETGLEYNEVLEVLASLRCKKCGRGIEELAYFCAACGEPTGRGPEPTRRCTCGETVPDAPFCNQCGRPRYNRGDMTGVTPELLKEMFLEKNSDILDRGEIDSLPYIDEEGHEKLMKDLEARVDAFNKECHLNDLPTIMLTGYAEDRDRINITVTAKPKYTVHCSCGCEVYSGLDFCPDCGMQHWHLATVENFYRETR